jgi:hypothetical protein
MVWPPSAGNAEPVTVERPDASPDTSLDTSAGERVRFASMRRFVGSWKGRMVVAVLVAALLAGLVGLVRDPAPVPFTQADAERAAKTVVATALQQAAKAPARSAEAYRTIARHHRRSLGRH